MTGNPHLNVFSKEGNNYIVIRQEVGLIWTVWNRLHLYKYILKYHYGGLSTTIYYTRFECQFCVLIILSSLLLQMLVLTWNQ